MDLSHWIFLGQVAQVAPGIQNEGNLLVVGVRFESSHQGQHFGGRGSGRA